MGGWRAAASAVLVLGACVAGDDEGDVVRPASSTTTHGTTSERTFPAPPCAPSGALGQGTEDALDDVAAGLANGELDAVGVGRLAATGDPRLAWFVSDLLRFLQGTPGEDVLMSAFAELTGVDPRTDAGAEASPWRAVTDRRPSSTATACACADRAVPSSSPTPRDGSPGASSIPAPRCGYRSDPDCELRCRGERAR